MTADLVISVDRAATPDVTVFVVRVGNEFLPLRVAAARLDFDTLLALGLCECGQLLSEHPPQPRRAPPLSSWMAQRTSVHPWRNTVTGKVRVWTEAQLHYRRRVSRTKAAS